MKLWKIVRKFYNFYQLNGILEEYKSLLICDQIKNKLVV